MGYRRIAGLPRARHCAILLAITCACANAAAQPVDAGPPDAMAALDAGAPHAAPVDAAPARPAPIDAAPARPAPIDAAPPNAMAPIDAGVARVAPVDAARARPAPIDAGPPDAMAALDAGAAPDADLAPDAGLTPDAGLAPDAGVPAAGAPAPASAEAAPDAGAADAPVADAPVVDTPPEAAPGSAESTLFAFKLIFGLAVLLALAYLGGHPRVLRLQEQIGIRGVILAGFPFVALGLIASLPSVGILTDDVIPKLRPVLQLGLGWIGFIIGAQLDIRVLDRVPRGSAYLLLAEAIAPFCVTAAVCGAVMIGVFGLSLHDPAVWRDIVLLGAAGAMTAPRHFRGFSNRTWSEGRGADVLLGQLDEIVGVIGLLFITAYFRHDAASAWQIPGTAWLFVAVGLGVTIGVLIFATIRLPRSNAEFLAIVLGAVAFASGLAGVLRLSPVVVCFVAGTLVANFPNDQRESVFRILDHLERPIHLLFLMIAGALWNVSDGRGWALVPLFVVCRVLGKWLGVGMTRTTLGSALPPEFTQRRKLVLPMSTMAIALVVSIERYRDIGLSWVVTAVIGGAVATELLVTATSRGEDDDDGAAAPPRSHSGRATPIDELDELDAPGSGGPGAPHPRGPA